MMVVILFIIKQIDHGGEYEYSSVVNVTPSSTVTEIRFLTKII